MKRLAYQYSWYRDIKAALRKAGKAGCFDSLMQDLDMADTRYTFVAEKNDKGDLCMTCLDGEGSPISSDLIPYPAKDFYHKIVNKLLA